MSVFNKFFKTILFLATVFFLFGCSGKTEVSDELVANHAGYIYEVSEDIKLTKYQGMDVQVKEHHPNKEDHTDQVLLTVVEHFPYGTINYEAEMVFQYDRASDLWSPIYEEVLSSGFELDRDAFTGYFYFHSEKDASPAYMTMLEITDIDSSGESATISGIYKYVTNSFYDYYEIRPVSGTFSLGEYDWYAEEDYFLTGRMYPCPEASLDDISFYFSVVDGPLASRSKSGTMFSRNPSLVMKRIDETEWKAKYDEALIDGNLYATDFVDDSLPDENSGKTSGNVQIEDGIRIFIDLGNTFGASDTDQWLFEDGDGVIGHLELKQGVAIRIRDSASTSGSVLGKAYEYSYLPYYEEKSADGYTWYLIDKTRGLWLGNDGTWMDFYD